MGAIDSKNGAINIKFEGLRNERREGNVQKEGCSGRQKVALAE